MSKTPGIIREGDTLKIVFYEQLEIDEGKWSGASGRPAAPRGFHLRTELSGEYEVGSDGSIVLPMIGHFMAAGIATEALKAALTPPFEKLLDRKGFVSILSVEHQPVYVVGPVKNPGAFKYRNGMTVLHAVALAGGFKREDVEPWQRVEAERQFENLYKTLERVKRLVVRTDVVTAERNGAERLSSDVVKLVGARDESSIAQEERFSRSLVAASLRTQETALNLALNDAKSELTARAGRLTPFDESIKLRRERVRNMEQLVGSAILNRPVLIQAQGELSELLDRRQQAEIDIETARQKVTKAEGDLTRLKLEARVELDRAVAATQRDTIAASDDGRGLLDVLRSLTSPRGGNGPDTTFTFNVIRKTDGSSQVVDLSETASLLPGDLVRVVPSEPFASR